jgi:beta-phosphoglucomutase-like phosphatase (HAD superfamily)
MSEEKVTRGVIVEVDFTMIDGASILFDITKEKLAGLGIDFSIKLEALHLAGGKMQGGFTELLEKLGKEADAVELANDIQAAFKEEVTKRFSSLMTSDVRNFIKKLTDREIKVVLSTRGDVEVLKEVCAELDNPLVVPYADTSKTYGGGKWDDWRRTLNANTLANILTVGITGSGHGVKAALLASVAAIAVVHDHVAYQDFGGADVAFDKFEEKIADEVIRVMHI